MPEENFETPQTTPPVKQKSTDWTKIILVAAIGLGLLAGAAYAGYYYGTQQVRPVEKPTPVVSQPTPTPTPTQIPQPTPLTESFQQILVENCRKIGDESSFFYGIAPDVLPVLIDLRVITLKLREQGTASCASADPPVETSYVFVPTEDNSGFHVYDENSVEGGHGGPPFLGTYGGVIKQTGSVTLSVYMGWPHGGPIFVGDFVALVRGVKELKLSNGETIFVSTSLTVIDKDDPRLLEVLDDYSDVSDSDPSRKEVTTSPGDVEAGVVARFFNNLTTLESPERENIGKLENILDAVTAR